MVRLRWATELKNPAHSTVKTSVEGLCYAKSLQSCPTLWDPTDGSPRGSPVPGILQERTRVGCHFLLQCMKVKSESEVTQSCPTLCNPMDCSLTGSSIHGISKQEYWSGVPLPSPIEGLGDPTKDQASTMTWVLNASSVRFSIFSSKLERNSSIFLSTTSELK